MQSHFKQTEVVLSLKTKTRRKVSTNNEPFFDAEKVKKMKSVDNTWYLAFAHASCGGEIAHDVVQAMTKQGAKHVTKVVSSCVGIPIDWPMNSE
eukprot:9403860-Pyramimonas_sp.AAC.1